MLRNTVIRATALLGLFVALGLAWLLLEPVRASGAATPVAVAAWLQAPAGIRLRGEIPLWGVLVALAALISTLAGVTVRLTSHSRQHTIHHKHAKDEDAHWTKRERTDLDDKLCDMGADIKELLSRNGGPRMKGVSS